ncbi:MAG TPA: ATP-binding domain-containing protein, partial [Candidatus Paceibacterota bacterium]
MLEVIRGTKSKPNSTSALTTFLTSTYSQEEGFVYIGYPIIATSIGSTNLDVVLVTEKHGIIIFDVVEGTNIDIDERDEKRDEIYLNVTSRLIQTKSLTVDRKLAVNLSVVTYAPAVKGDDSDEIFYKNDSLKVYIDSRGSTSNAAYFQSLKSAVQTVTKLKASNKRSNVTKRDSRGGTLKLIGESIAHLDSKQNRAVVETVEGLQRIRGLAGSGKTIILALKAAYLHSVYPDWKIAVTFNTRSLHGQFKDLVTKFTIEQKGEDPDWEKLKIIHAWGSARNPGVYYEFCELNNIAALDFRTALVKFGRKHPFANACESALKEARTRQQIVFGYDAILVDEAQDFAYPFLQLCFEFLPEPKRLVWAYDELQNLEQMRMPTPRELFGRELKNNPDSPKEDIILERCYRNPGPVLVTAHSLGFGIYRNDGLVQMFDDPSLWKDIGYKISSGSLEKGAQVVLERDNDTSPVFLENHSDIDDLIIFKTFNDKPSQAEWIASQIEDDLKNEELRYRDIIIINLDARTVLDDTSLLRAKLFEKNIRTHVPGESTSPDVFFEDNSVAVTSIYRAKGNEAPMIYIMDGHFAYSGPQLTSGRNKLFSAITRSKAWVRVTGVGEKMTELE